jgi:arylsulfatase A-like enzyme
MLRRSFLLQSAAAAFAQEHRPNIVLIMADDLGYECLGCNGGTSYRTPQLDTLARTGVRFTHGYATPLCAPTRLQLMTGKYNFRNYEAFGILNPNEKTFGHHMQAAGYRTAIAGKWQLYSYNPPDYEPEWRGKGMLPKDSGFEEYCLWHTGHTEDKGSRYADPRVLENGRLRDYRGRYGEDIFVSFLSAIMERHRNEPFFVYYPMALPHAPFVPTPNSPEWRSGDRHLPDNRFYRDMVEYMDTSVGRLVAHIDRLGIRDNTFILFFSDNGSPREITSRMSDRLIRGGKGSTTDAGMHVPLIANWRGTSPSGRIADDLVDSTDFLPTMLDAAGVWSGRFDGRSFLPQVRGKTGEPREWLYSWYDPRPGWDKEQFSLKIHARDTRYKLYSTGELYDVMGDPLEQSPLAPGVAADVRARLAAVIRDFNDRLPESRRR